MATPTAGVFPGYDDPRSHFSKRLTVVQRAVGDTLAAMPPGPITVLDICGGVGKALLPVLSTHPRRDDVRAWIVELDPESVRLARETVTALGLSTVQTVEGDAGLSDTYRGVERANLVILSGVLAHLSPADRARTVAFLRQICAPDARLVWTIGNRFTWFRVQRVRRQVAASGFALLERHRISRYLRAAGISHEIGVGRLTRPPEPLEPGTRVFSFRVPFPRRYPRLRRLLRQVRSLVRAMRARRSASN